MPALHYLQHQHGYLPGWAMEVVDWHLGIPASEVFGAATSYTGLRFNVPGRQVIRACIGLGCWINGGRALLTAAGSTLSILPERLRRMDLSRWMRPRADSFAAWHLTSRLTGSGKVEALAPWRLSFCNLNTQADLDHAQAPAAPECHVR